MTDPAVPLLALVTAVHAERDDFFADLAASVDAARRLVPSLVWAVAVDGVSPLQPAASDALARADTVTVLGDRFGVSAARNMAAAHTTTTWLLPVDGDDLVVPDGVAALAGTLAATPDDVGWVSSNRVEMDGSPHPDWAPEPRSWAPGELDLAYPGKFHPNSVAYRASVLWDAGGWVAVPGGEDMVTTLRVARAAPGTSTTDVTLRYRRWAGQTTAAPAYLRPGARADRHLLYGLLGGLSGRRPAEQGFFW